MSDPAEKRSRPWLALVLAVVLLGYAIWLLNGANGDSSVSTEPTGAHAVMLAVAPGGIVELDSLPEGHQQMYRAAAADPAAFAAVTCYCGCEQFLDHKHLLDCFVRPNDGAWERHATGCAVCMLQARDVVSMRADNRSLDDIIRQIDDRYSAITAAIR